MTSYFMNFDKLIGTKLITILYYLGLLGIALGAIAGIFGGLAGMGISFLGGLGAIVVSLIGAVIGVLVWRFVCELYLLLFRMADDLREIRNAKAGTPPAA